MAEKAVFKDAKKCDFNEQMQFRKKSNGEAQFFTIYYDFFNAIITDYFRCIAANYQCLSLKQIKNQYFTKGVLHSITQVNSQIRLALNAEVG